LHVALLLLLLQHSSAQHLTTQAAGQQGGQARAGQNSQRPTGSSQTARQPGQKLGHAMTKRAEFS